MQKGFTLIELMVAVTLITVIITATTMLDLANNQLYLVTTTEMELLQEINAAVTHVHQSVRNAAVVSVDQATKTISVTTGGTTGVYRWEDSADSGTDPDQLRYYPTGSGSYQVVSTGITDFAMDYPTPVNSKVSYFNITLKATGQWGGAKTKNTTVRASIGARPFQGVTVQVI